ncbi:hypothetical protein NEOLEDRAFT_1172850 [Neolentinus lepideus HHB14362 ss-1]|uniref:HNH nuclease domain-containing protein n=1 Tax=Neolentinus lepideus HHB14362 ss-1 TaxID=1314782 RepID=A0A165NLP4_9AGAM|nr:hypothetical protein NEOLEDRAFT_1172850 [Neolentinus lepideus HHB14362 ss-1]
MPSTPLPESPGFDAEGTRTWQLLLRAEKMAMPLSRAATSKYKDQLVAVRVLGWFLKDFWDHTSRTDFGLLLYHRLITEISSCYHTEQPVEVGHSKVIQLGLSYSNQLLRVCRSDTGPTPTPSSDVSHPSFDAMMVDSTINGMKTAPKSKSEAKIQALVRDGYRCMISGILDYDSVGDQDVPVTMTQCAHLFSEFGQDKDKMFGLNEVVQSLLGGQVNNLGNVLTMSDALHRKFDEYEFWLEEVDGQLNTYDLRARHEKFFRLADNPRRRVKFEVDQGVLALCAEKGLLPPPLPNRNLIAIRSACARVAHVSGAAELVVQLLRDRGETSVMASDGSTAPLLTSLLLHAPFDRITT